MKNNCENETIFCTGESVIQNQIKIVLFPENTRTEKSESLDYSRKSFSGDIAC